MKETVKVNSEIYNLDQFVKQRIWNSVGDFPLKGGFPIIPMNDCFLVHYWSYYSEV